MESRHKDRQTDGQEMGMKTKSGTDRQTYRQTDIFFIVVLGLGEVNKHAKKS